MMDVLTFVVLSHFYIVSVLLSVLKINPAPLSSYMFKSHTKLTSSNPHIIIGSLKGHSLE